MSVYVSRLRFEFVSGHAFRDAETKLLKFRTPTRRNCQRLKPH